MVETIQDFKDRWRKRAEEIKKQSFDREQCQKMISAFELETLILRVENGEPNFFKTQEIRTDLIIALEIAYSNFRKEKKGFWSKIFGGKKELNLLKIK
ncbi:MAG TPA: hypothetical protein VMW67_05520 [Desulfobacteria bacterium]|nr:hypothetical protein [Desulfobacteria bacterium]